MATTLAEQLLVPIEEQLLEASQRYFLLGGARPVWMSLEELLSLEAVTETQGAPENNISRAGQNSSRPYVM